MNKVADIAMALVFVAGVTTVVAHKESAKVVTALGGLFIGSLRAAEGR